MARTRPSCLLQLGADVIKVESPAGDMSRKIPPHFVDGESSFFLSVNRGKRSVALDLKHVDGMAALRDLVRVSDVVIYNFTPNVPRRLGIDHASLLTLNPRVCVGEMIGLHDEGEYASIPAFDLAIQALAGIMSITGEADGQPARVGYQIADLAGGLYLALGTVGALLRALRTGKGQYVQVSLLDCQLALLTWQAQSYLASGKVPGRLGSRHPMIAPSETFLDSEGRHFVVTTAESFWRPFCEAIGRNDLADDPRFVTAAARIAHVEELAAQLQATFRAKPAAEWLAALRRAPVPSAMVNNVDEALREPVVGSPADARDRRQPRHRLVAPVPRQCLQVRGLEAAGVPAPPWGAHAGGAARRLRLRARSHRGIGPHGSRHAAR